MEPGADPFGPLDRFRDVVSGGPDEVSLDVASIAMAAVLTGPFDETAAYHQLDSLAVGITDVAGLLSRLYETHGFSGTCPPVADPALSFLNRVLEVRTGLPILMGVLLIEVGRRARLDIRPVNLPLHFVVADGSRPGAFIDPCSGTVMNAGEVEAFLARWSSGRMPWADRHLRVVPHRHVVIRMLTNLQTVYQGRRDPLRLALVGAMRAAIPELAQERPTAVRLGAVFN
jgi:regulator of sirC expression with transglutaminase-like and TPR domain